MDASIELQGSNRQAVLLLHGLCARPLELLPVAKRLHQAGYTVRVPHISGYGADIGGTPGVGRPGIYENWLAQARRHAQELAATHEQLAVGGLSVGAVLALALAAEITPAALLLMSPTLYYDGWNASRWRGLLPLARLPVLRDHLSFGGRAPYGIKNARLRDWIVETLEREGTCVIGAARVPAASLHQAGRLIERVQAQLAEVRSPTLVLHSTEDDIAGPRNVHELRNRLGAGEVAVQWFHDSYHLLTLDNECDAVAAAALDFVAGRLHGASPGFVPAPTPGPNPAGGALGCSFAYEDRLAA